MMTLTVIGDDDDDGDDGDDGDDDDSDYNKNNNCHVQSCGSRRITTGA